ncbi:polyA polymerase [Cardiosporidium cionae]|uniref:Poly(A) polymerase n=1 Tax=Cardiosporidium cionae TaxID=476202 RepID=A0ABQ7JAS3_9APIC|nr:polyA polymerase [Cardiosporidium cionae]|eukprot:KAF8821092.1 polyA polymerase [Cardiosporidium cionae]
MRSLFLNFTEVTIMSATSATPAPQLTPSSDASASTPTASASSSPYPYGVTPPISEKPPLPRDELLTADLVQILRSHNLYESEAGCRRREQVLRDLNRLLVEWIYEVSLEQGLSEEEARAAGGHIFTFGSYRLGVVSPGSDIDTLCVAPNFVTRNAFFSSFFAKLQQDPNVSRLQSVPDAYTPIIKLVYDGVDIDLLFASLQMNSIPKDLTTLTDDSMLKNVDDVTARCLNGCRVADMILQQVPNKESFRTTLRFIKYWAKNRGIYSNVLGYLGGVSWALLVARICQLYPNYVSSQLIERFFRILEQWKWKNPVVLCKIKGPQNILGLMEFKVWNPKTNIQDSQHLMPIVTPAFPSMNSTHNVTQTTMRIMHEELHRGYELVRKAILGSCTWDDILEPLDIFSLASHFLQFRILAQSDLIHQKWKGWVESKIRFLVKELEQLKLILFRPWPFNFAFKSDDWHCASSMFISICLISPHTGASFIPLLKEPISMFVLWLCMPVFDISLRERERFSKDALLEVQYLRSSQLPSYLFEKEKSDGTLTAKPQKGAATLSRAAAVSPSSSMKRTAIETIASEKPMHENKDTELTQKRPKNEEVSKPTSIPNNFQPDNMRGPLSRKMVDIRSMPSSIKSNRAAATPVSPVPSSSIPTRKGSIPIKIHGVSQRE